MEEGQRLSEANYPGSLTEQHQGSSVEDVKGPVTERLHRPLI